MGSITRHPTGQDLACLVCHKGDNIDIDHVVNRGSGGSKERDIPENKVPLCRECHELKTLGRIATRVDDVQASGLGGEAEGYLYCWKKADSDLWITVPVEVSERYKCLVLNAAAEGQGRGGDSIEPSIPETEPSAAAPSAGLKEENDEPTSGISDGDVRGANLGDAHVGGSVSSPLTHEQRVAIAQETPSNLPALLDALTRAVDEAQTVPELKGIRDRAEAIRKWAKSAGAGLQAQNWIADKKIVCERKAGDLLAGMDLDKGGRPSTNRLQDAIGLPDLGIEGTQSHRWQREASVEEGEYRAYVQTCNETETELTSAGLLRLWWALRMGETSAIQSSDSNEWYTPKRYIEAARGALGGIDLDPASSAKANEVVKAESLYSIEDDGLSRDWSGRVWLNPPYGSDGPQFVLKLLSEYESGRIESAIVLLNSHATDAGWFQGLWDHTLCFTNHRIDFIPGDPLLNPSSSTHGSVFVYLGPDPRRFAQHFSQLGAVVRKFDDDNQQG